MSSWASKYIQCVKCGTVDVPHEAKGMCTRCYDNLRYCNEVKAERNYTCTNCGKVFSISRRGKRAYTFCSRSCKTIFQRDSFKSKEEISDAVLNVIKSEKRYLTTEDVRKKVGVTSRTLGRFGISIVALNEQLGYKSKKVFEDRVAVILSKVYPDLVREKKFPGCLSPRGFSLRFDFYSEAQKILIEADGIHHYCGPYHSEEIVVRDGIKNMWASDNGFPLIRIPYKRSFSDDYVLSYLNKCQSDSIVDNQQPSLEGNLSEGSTTEESLNSSVEEHDGNSYCSLATDCGMPETNELVGCDTV